MDEETSPLDDLCALGDLVGRLSRVRQLGSTRSETIEALDTAIDDAVAIIGHELHEMRKEVMPPPEGKIIELRPEADHAAPSPS